MRQSKLFYEAQVKSDVVDFAIALQLLAYPRTGSHCHCHAASTNISLPLVN
ncbi:hypothetical protein N0Y54_22805 [Nostoc punctiforme UO1]|uniref:hypothetical protein n=1 Tax=Nostoc punctiforme TaxID=272131 RepID=UPI0030A8C1BD